MPTYTIDGPDGKTYSLDGPPGKSRDEVIAAIKKRMGIGKQPPVTPQQYPSPGATGQDIARGAVQGLARGTQELLNVVPRMPNPNPAAMDVEMLLPEAQPGQARPQDVLSQKITERGPQALAEKYVTQPQTPVGEATASVFEGVPTAPLQPGGLLTKAVTTIGAGLGSYAGEQLADYFGFPKWAGRFFGGLFGGGVSGGGAQITAEREARKFLPTAAETKTFASGMYKQIEQHGLVAEPTEVQNFATGLRADLEKNYMTDRGGKVGFEAANRIEKANGKLSVIMDEYSRLGTVKPTEGANYAAAQIARDAIQEWLGNLQPNQIISGDPQFIKEGWEAAREAWRVQAGLETIDKALQSGTWRRLSSGQGHNLNAMRQQIRGIITNDKRARRFTVEEREQMAQIVEGGVAENVLRQVAAFAPHGAVSSIPTLIVGATQGLDAALLVGAAGVTTHLLRRYLEARSVALLQDLIREQSPKMTGQARRARAALLPPGRVGAATARGALSAGAGSPLAEEQPTP